MKRVVHWNNMGQKRRSCRSALLLLLLLLLLPVNAAGGAPSDCWRKTRRFLVGSAAAAAAPSVYRRGVEGASFDRLVAVARTRAAAATAARHRRGHRDGSKKDVQWIQDYMYRMGVKYAGNKRNR